MSEKELNFAYFGTPDVASRTLEILYTAGYMPKIIITSPDRKSGRGMEMHESETSKWAREHNIPCLKPEKIDGAFIEVLKKEFEKLEITLSIVVAYGKILPETLIKHPKLGTVNIHYSLLPMYRGASPLEACLLAGDTVTGVSIQQMAYKLDSGAIINESQLGINIEDTKKILRDKLIKLGGESLCEILPKIESGDIDPKIQNENLATYCSKITKEDGEINIEGDARKNYNKYRAYYGWPGVYFFTKKHGKKIRVKITKAKYENNSFIIEQVIPEGKKETDYKNFLINTSK